MESSKLALISWTILTSIIESAIIATPLSINSSSVDISEGSYIRSASRALSGVQTSHDKRLVLETILHSPASAEQSNQKRAITGGGGGGGGASLISEREPKWWDACNRRLSLNDTLIDIMINPQSHHLNQMLDEDRSRLPSRYNPSNSVASNRKETLTKLASSSFATDAVERRKRSTMAINWPKKTKHQWTVDQSANQIGYLLEDEGGGILFDTSKQQPPNGEKATKNLKSDKYNYGIKKTSFSMLNANKYSSKGQRYYHSMYANNQQKPVVQQFVKQSSEDIMKVSSTGETGVTQVQLIMNRIPVIKTILEGIFAQDIRMSWQLSCALNTANSVRRLVAYVRRLLSHQQKLIDSVKQINYEQDDGIDWIPKLDSLIRKRNHDNKINESRFVLTNVTHYLQFFNVALEQMVFEQRGLSTNDRRLALISQGYKDLDRASLKILCDIESLVKLLDNLESNKRELIDAIKNNNLAPKDEQDPLKQLNLTSMEKRLGYTNDTIESAYWISSGKQWDLIVNKNASANFVLLSRKVMPQNQRNLQSELARKARDYKILDLFDKMLDYYESVLKNIYS